MKLHLACGPVRLDGWVNIDIDSPVADRRWDLRRPLPYPAQSIEAIFCEHFIEHITRPDAVRFLADCHRLLRPDGTVRLSTPDLRWLVAKFLDAEIDHWSDVGWTSKNPCHLLNEGMRHWGHQWVYDAEDLRAVLTEAGFREIEEVAWRVSANSLLHGLESRPYHREIIVEATRRREPDVALGRPPLARRLPPVVERVARRLVGR
jgi:predicted SAM-dependent methyltransferase